MLIIFYHWHRLPPIIAIHYILCLLFLYTLIHIFNINTEITFFNGLCVYLISLPFLYKLYKSIIVEEIYVDTRF